MTKPEGARPGGSTNLLARFSLQDPKGEQRGLRREKRRKARERSRKKDYPKLSQPGRQAGENSVSAGPAFPWLDRGQAAWEEAAGGETQEDALGRTSGDTGPSLHGLSVARLRGTRGGKSCNTRIFPIPPVEGRTADSWLDRDPADARTPGELGRSHLGGILLTHSCVEQEAGLRVLRLA
ncbi:hypothetical protein NDU88_002610 [Pleurodeles waltl]|uniref:Uncharacterized protein n=1 Tax=Pleurodeles waltl TaxID=8319 RepID=A0AAV7RCD6_PLEWA|nr:hypothetical protein NDU88_002610 [Pleurodeles waltl]